MIDQNPREMPSESDLPRDFEDRTPLEIEDDRWDAFLPDDDQLDPLPDPGDFWIEDEQLELRLRAA